ncbi:uncharacterized protein LOC128471755 [Spea bombifrons]|uniref:uncharacterized protein LOC128471755 n=1 Tax=Spea bombifrons TaxID=233779 RepID=UPI00234A0307|nr:uncharacterized protein LOC128471755 [Spea bombifrons]
MAVLKLKKFTMEESANMEEHRTHYYNTSSLVLRRGQSFRVTLHFNRPMQKREKVFFTAATGPEPQESDQTMAYFQLLDSKTEGSWSAFLDSKSSEDVNVTINSPADAVIGRYKLSICIYSKRKRGYFKLHDIILLFNPWAPDDAVFMEDESERQEYVLNDSGIMYFGHEEFIENEGWNFGQFEEGILDICLLVLDKSLQHQSDPALDCSQRNDPGYVGRVVSSMINSNDDDGVLEGRWSGKFWFGTDPQMWIGSVEILTRWQKKGFKPVKYGQCWVFAGVMCTVLRGLGIPTRVVTNFASAHDKEGNLSVDNIYTVSGKKMSKDSMWNYHVWNESWFTRPDLGPAYGGWQVLDATPQELSEEIYCCGPASVHAIKGGELHLGYDTQFVFSEVNADQYTWIYYDKGLKEKVYSNSAHVGKSISTKAVGSDERVDITENYKYPEGSDEERSVYTKACMKLLELGILTEDNLKERGILGKSSRGRAEDEDLTGEITGKFKLVSSPEFGQDVNLILVLKNSSTKSESVRVKLSSSSIEYTGKPRAEIFKNTTSVTIAPTEETQIPVNIPAGDYEEELTQDNLIEVAALCVLKSKKKLLVRRVVSIEKPPVEIKILGYPVVDEPLELMINYKNPLSEWLKDGVLVLEGSGLVEKQIKKKVPKLEPKGIGSIRLEITPYRSGDKQLVVDFASKYFPVIKGFQSVYVENVPDAMEMAGKGFHQCKQDPLGTRKEDRENQCGKQNRKITFKHPALISDALEPSSSVALYILLLMGGKGNWLQLKSVNLNLVENKAAHHTSDYMSDELILRRKQAFQINLNFNRALESEDGIAFIVERGNSPQVENRTKAKFFLSSSVDTVDLWSATADSTGSSSLLVTFISPVNVPIGRYKLRVQLFSENISSHLIGEFILLFNPWESEDDVYLDNEEERIEYILSDNTILYYGDDTYIGEQGWNLGQFEEGILDICLTLLEKNSLVDNSLLHDPKHVGRICSAMINSNDDNGVVVGNWSGQYDGGVSPVSWTGSVQIMKKWITSGPVRYGQCWVFAGVLCTVLRCLGIPTRIVTNFSSAHDTNANLSIDSYFDEEGNSLKGNDSIWNFHVWNEVWLTRKDLGHSYDGWQALDATPQERSDGVFRLGPTSVKAVKEGEILLKYDGAFVFSEVNADVAAWVYNEDEKKFEQIHTDSYSIGKFTSTKAVGTDDRIDITNHYKYEEGSDKEREVYYKAFLQLFGWTTFNDETSRMITPVTSGIARRPARKPAIRPKVSGKLKSIDSPFVGEDIKIILSISNSTSSDKAVKIKLNVTATSYTRKIMRKFMNEFRSLTLRPIEEKEIPFDIPYSQYARALTDDNVVEVTALCEVDMEEKLLISKSITLKRPRVNIKVLNEAIINKQLHVEVTFTNPLSEDLVDCKLHAEGSGLIKEQLMKLTSLKPKEETSIALELIPYTKGSKQLQIMIQCGRFLTMKGYKVINVKGS